MLEVSNVSKTYENGVKALQDADTGNIRFDGHDVLNDPQFLRSQLGYLPH